MAKRKFKREELQAAIDQAMIDAPDLIRTARAKLAAKGARAAGKTVGRKPKLVQCPKCELWVKASELNQFRKCPHKPA